MLKLSFKNDPHVYDAEFGIVSGNIVRLMGDIPANTSGFQLSRIGHDDKWDYSDYTTIYRQGEGFVEYSNDGSVYVEPEPVPNPEPVPSSPSYDDRIQQLEEELKAAKILLGLEV